MRNRFGIAAIFIRAATCLNTVLLCTAFVEAAALDLTVVDANGSPVPCRVLVRTSPGSSVIPEGAVELKIGPDRWFMSTGRSSILVPAGTVELRVEKGPEYTPFKGTVTVAEPHSAKTVTLERWIDMDERAYVRSGQDTSIGRFYEAWAAGKNFVTNGPMLFLETGDGLKPGGTLKLPAHGGKLLLRVTALSDQPLTSVELVINGRSMSFPVQSPRQTVIETEVEITQGSWIAAHCQSRDDLLTDSELSAYANGDREQPSRLRFAHTSPIYVTVGGRGAALPEAIREGLKMLDHFAIFARRQAATEHRQTILEATIQARRELEKKLP